MPVLVIIIKSFALSERGFHICSKMKPKFITAQCIIYHHVQFSSINLSSFLLEILFIIIIVFEVVYKLILFNLLYYNHVYKRLVSFCSIDLVSFRFPI